VSESGSTTDSDVSFCPYCGTSVTWIVGATGERETKKSCPSCDGELHRNPEVHVLCLVHDREAEAIHAVGACIADHETVQETSRRLLGDNDGRIVAGSEFKLFGLVDDFDRDRVYIVFRARLDNLSAVSSGTDPLGKWVTLLCSRLREALKVGNHVVQEGTVRNRRLSWGSQDDGSEG